MYESRVFITGIGIISPLGQNISSVIQSLKKNISGIVPLTLFPVKQSPPHNVGQIPYPVSDSTVPRTHALALAATQDALKDSGIIPDAVIIGTTTGGMIVTEELIKNKINDPDEYRYHGTGTVAQYVAEKTECTGPVMTLTTACSSGTVSIKLALEMLRSGKVKSVLAGGVDSLCRLTYFGFSSLQLIDPDRSRPLDRDRAGMSVAEGSAVLLLEACEEKPDNAIAEILGAGLTCDAYHPAAPHPEGDGAVQSINNALNNAGISPEHIDYINLHGTGTPDNDKSESRALHRVFKDRLPPLSSVKGAFGHSLGASGAIEAAVCAAAIKDEFLPANTGYVNPDPELNLDPLIEPCNKAAAAILSNSFGFGGNNASLVLCSPDSKPGSRSVARKMFLNVLGCSCITGAGSLEQTIKNLQDGKSTRGKQPGSEIPLDMPPRDARRLKRLSRLSLSLAMDLVSKTGTDTLSAVFYGTNLGPQTETFDFLKKLYQSDEQYLSPTDFVGSVHNAPAGHIAIKFKCTGPNITTTGGNHSFEQSLMSASTLAHELDKPFLLMAADEAHDELTPLLDPSTRSGELSDGGAALLIEASESKHGITMGLLFSENPTNNPAIIQHLIDALGGSDTINEKFGAVFTGIPSAQKMESDNQLNSFLEATGYTGALIDYRKVTGDFAAVSAVIAALSFQFLSTGTIPGFLVKGDDVELKGKGILHLGLGDYITAYEMNP